MDGPASSTPAAVENEASIRRLAALAAAAHDDGGALVHIAALESDTSPEQQVVDCLSEFSPPDMSWERPWMPHIVRWLRRAAEQGQTWAVTRLANDDFLDGIAPNERDRWLMLSASAGSARSAFLLALSTPDKEMVEDLLRKVWRAASEEHRATDAAKDDLAPDMTFAAAHLLASLLAERADPEAKRWFERCTNAEHWFERHTGTNRNGALLDYSRWATRERDDDLAEALLAELTDGAMKGARLTTRVMEDGRYKSYRDDWQDNLADVWAWRAATVEHAALLLESGYTERADLVIRVASEIKHFPAAALPVVTDVLTALGAAATARTLLAQTAEPLVPRRFSAQIGALVGAGSP